LQNLKALKNSQHLSFLDVCVDFCLGDGQCPLLVDLFPDFDVLMGTPSTFLQLDDI